VCFCEVCEYSNFLSGEVTSLPAQLPAWRSIWHLPLHLSAKGDNSSSYTIASTAFEVCNFMQSNKCLKTWINNLSRLWWKN
jgi:hypothetical protein